MVEGALPIFAACHNSLALLTPKAWEWNIISALWFALLTPKAWEWNSISALSICASDAEVPGMESYIRRGGSGRWLHCIWALLCYSVVAFASAICKLFSVSSFLLLAGYWITLYLVVLLFGMIIYWLILAPTKYLGMRGLCLLTVSKTPTLHVSLY